MHCYRFFDGVNNGLCIEGVGKIMAYNFAAVPVNNDSVVSEQIGNDGLFEISFREIGFGVNGINRHQLHQTPDSFTSHLVAILTELYGYFIGAQIQEFYMPVVNTTHQFLLLRDALFIRRNRQVVAP